MPGLAFGQRSAAAGSVTPPPGVGNGARLVRARCRRLWARGTPDHHRAVSSTRLLVALQEDISCRRISPGR